MIERYIAGRLPDEETEAFEQHYLECRHCFEELELRHSAAIELARQPFRSAPMRSGWLSLPWRWVIPSAAALVVALVAVYVWIPVQHSQPGKIVQSVPDTTEVLKQLGSIEPYPYVPASIRGVAETNPAAMARFEEGMRAYNAGKYGDALVPLSEAAGLAPGNNPIAFYLGISNLLLSRPDDAIPQFSKLISPDNPYAEDSHWYLAKAYLQKKEVAKAVTELETVSMLDKGRAGEAQELLRRLAESGLRQP